MVEVGKELLDTDWLVVEFDEFGIFEREPLKVELVEFVGYYTLLEICRRVILSITPPT